MAIEEPCSQLQSRLRRDSTVRIFDQIFIFARPVKCRFAALLRRI